MNPTIPLRSLSNLTTTLPTRRWSPLLEPLTPLTANRLSQSLRPFVPEHWVPPLSAVPVERKPLPAGYHLVYFNPLLAPAHLLPDGTDARHSPGGPFVRRMWAGGSVRFNSKSKGVILDGDAGVCLERIRDVSVKGPEGREKVFVGIERRIGRVEVDKLGKAVDSDEQIENRLWSEDENEFKGSLLVERRNIVFMRERSKEELEEAMKMVDGPRNRKVKKATQEPSLTHTLTPTSTLLFRYSALTLNAHLIHLDAHYCRTTEGHRNLLVHGPLTCTLLMLMLAAQVGGHHNPGSYIKSFEYRNVAPLYAEEPMRLALRDPGRKGESESEYQLWAENSVGEVAVKASARIVEGHGP